MAQKSGYQLEAEFGGFGVHARAFFCARSKEDRSEKATLALRTIRTYVEKATEQGIATREPYSIARGWLIPFEHDPEFEINKLPEYGLLKTALKRLEDTIEENRKKQDDRRIEECRQSLLDALKFRVECVGKVLADHVELILHDVRHFLRTGDPNKTVIAVTTANVTHRQIGDRLTDFGIRFLKRKKDQAVYQTTYEREGKKHVYRCGTVSIKDTRGGTIGLLCVNINTTEVAEVLGAQVAQCYSVDDLPEEKKLFDQEVDGVLKGIDLVTFKNKHGPDWLNALNREYSVFQIDYDKAARILASIDQLPFEGFLALLEREGITRLPHGASSGGSGASNGAV